MACSYRKSSEEKQKVTGSSGTQRFAVLNASAGCIFLVLAHRERVSVFRPGKKTLNKRGGWSWPTLEQKDNGKSSPRI
jgi:hypothetical protein